MKRVTVNRNRPWESPSGAVVRSATEILRLEEERLYLESEISADYSFEDSVGKSAALRQVLEQVAIVAPTDSTVSLHGTTGTGKELIARAVNNLSPRCDRTFVRLDCAAIPSELVERYERDPIIFSHRGQQRDSAS